MKNTTMPSISQLISEGDEDALKEALVSLTPFEIADIVVNRPEDEQKLIVQCLSIKNAVIVLDFLPTKTQHRLLEILEPEQVSGILKEIAPDDLTELLKSLPRPTIDEYLKELPTEERSTAISLLGYPETSVGHLMTPDYIAVKEDWTIENVLEHIRAYGHDSETINMIYVVNDNNVLLDDINIREFLFYPRDYLVKQLTDYKFIALHDLENAEDAIEVFKKYDRTALPVIDENGVIKGIVTIDDILRLASDMFTQDIQKIGGVDVFDESYMEIPFSALIVKRAKWLIVIFVGEMFTASVMAFFEDTISKAVVLALFLPLIISSGGNAGSQSSTLIIRAMALGEITVKDWYRVFRRELTSGLVLGAMLGFIGLLRIVIWNQFSTIYGEYWFRIGITICFSLIGIVLWGSLSGAMLPLILRRAKIDPATASAPLVATLVDITGILLYFGIALLILTGTVL